MTCLYDDIIRWLLLSGQADIYSDRSRSIGGRLDPIALCVGFAPQPTNGYETSAAVNIWNCDRM